MPTQPRAEMVRFGDQAREIAAIRTTVMYNADQFALTRAFSTGYGFDDCFHATTASMHPSNAPKVRTMATRVVEFRCFGDKEYTGSNTNMSFTAPPTSRKRSVGRARSEVTTETSGTAEKRTRVIRCRGAPPTSRKNPRVDSHQMNRATMRTFFSASESGATISSDTSSQVPSRSAEKFFHPSFAVRIRSEFIWTAPRLADRKVALQTSCDLREAGAERLSADGRHGRSRPSADEQA